MNSIDFNDYIFNKEYSFGADPTQYNIINSPIKLTKPFILLSYMNGYSNYHTQLLLCNESDILYIRYYNALTKIFDDWYSIASTGDYATEDWVNSNFTNSSDLIKNYVNKNTTINNKSLSNNIIIDAEDVNAISSNNIVTSITSDSTDNNIATAKAVFNSINNNLNNKDEVIATAKYYNLSGFSVNNSSSYSSFPISYNTSTGADDIWSGQSGSKLKYVATESDNLSVAVECEITNTDKKGTFIIEAINSKNQTISKSITLSKNQASTINISGNLDFDTNDILTIQYTSSFKFKLLELNTFCGTHTYRNNNCIVAPTDLVAKYKTLEYWLQIKDYNNLVCTGSNIGLSTVSTGILSAIVNSIDTDNTKYSVNLTFQPYINSNDSSSLFTYYATITDSGFSGWYKTQIEKV